MKSGYVMSRREFNRMAALGFLGLALSPYRMLSQDYSEGEIKELLKEIHEATFNPESQTLPRYDIELDGREDNGKENVTIAFGDSGRKMDILLSYYRIQDDKNAQSRLWEKTKTISTTITGDEMKIDKNEFDEREIGYLPKILEEIRKGK